MHSVKTFAHTNLGTNTSSEDADGAITTTGLTDIEQFEDEGVQERCIAVFNAVCPPRVGSNASGRSSSMTLATNSGVIGST